MNGRHGPVEVVEVADPEECARVRARFEQFSRNSQWLKEHASEVYSKHRGSHICIAGQELFVASSAKEALASAQAAHPEDRGRFVRYIPKERVARIYAH
jgi:hypothetical protein